MRKDKKESHHSSQQHHQQPQQHHQPQRQQHHQPQQQHHSAVEQPRYGTFQGGHHQSPQPAGGFHQPAGSTARGYHPVPGSEEAGKTPGSQSPLPCCGCGVGWCLFILGFLLAGIPWYIAACILLCGKIDSREKPGYIACAVGAVLVTIAIIVVVVFVV